MLFEPAKIRSVVEELVGAVPEAQLPTVDQFRLPPLPFHVQVVPRAAWIVARKIMAQTARVKPGDRNAKPVPSCLKRGIVRWGNSGFHASPYVFAPKPRR